MEVSTGITSIIILIIIYDIIKKNYSEIKRKKEFEEKQYKNIYRKKEKLLTDNEKIFYKCLLEAVKDKDIIIQTQVVLYEIIETKKHKYHNLYFNKIKSKSIDYVLVDKEFKILICIELDDSTHDRIDRIKRDIFINKVFLETNTRLIRVPVQPYYNVNRIRKLIEECL